MDWVKTTDLTQWADSLDCQSNLPALVRRLVRATIRHIKEMKFPAGENVQMGGWDGYLEVGQGNEFVPDGISVWEFGAGKQPSTKAESDYAKRKANSLGVDPKQATFVFVTPRIWDKSDEWVEQKIAEGYWRDVRVITAVNLEEWIETAPSVGFWLATTHLKKCPYTDIMTTDKFWEEWSFNGKERLLPSLLLSGREENQNKLTENYIGNRWIGIRSISQEESLAFIIATFITDELVSEDFFSRSLVVSSRDAFRSLEVSAQPLILIPRFVDIGLFASAIQRGHSVIVPLGSEDNNIQEAINLDEIGRDGFVNSLKESGYKNAEQLSRETVRNIGVLRRTLGFERNKPRWAMPENIRAVIPAIIVGRWQNSYEGDKETLASVAGLAYNDYISTLSPWMISSDSPIIKLDDYWRLISPYDAFFHSYPYWTQQDFTKLEEAVIKVFSDTDESIQKKESSDDLWTQFRHQSTNRYSHALREGLLMTLILIGEYGVKVNNPAIANPQEWVDGIVMRILVNDDQYFWKTITNHLPLIAEASPESFLARVEAMENDSTNTVTQGLFSKHEGHDPLFHKNYSLGMLSALESLAWEPKYLARVSKILLTLSEIPIASNIGNKPINSLKEIFQPWHCQTFAAYEEQKDVLQLLLKQNSDTAWRLFISIMPDPHGGLSFPTHRMRWRLFGQIRDVYYRNDSNDMWNFVFDRLLENADHRVDRYSDLINISANIGEHNRTKLFEQLQKDRDQIDDGEAILWNRLRKFIHRHQEFPDAEWSLSPETLKPYLRLYEYLTPQDVLKKNLWVFDEHQIEMVNPEPISERLGEKWYEKALDFRKSALQEIYDQKGLRGILDNVSDVKEPQYLGETLAYLISDAQIAETVNYFSKSTSDFRFLRSLFWKLSLIRNDEELFKILDSLNLNSLPLDIAGNILTSIKQAKEFWDYIGALDQSLIDYYWNNVRLTNWGGSDDEILFGISKLFEHKRYSSAANYVHMVFVTSHTLPGRILADCLLGIVFDNKENILPGSYEITQLLNRLDTSTDVDEEQKTRIELFTVLLHRDGDYKPKRVFKTLSEDVESCMEMIRWKWIQKDEIDEKDEFAARYKFKIAWEILDKFNIIPGMREDGTIDGTVLNNWVDNLRSGAAEAGKLQYADSLIGDLFGTYPRKAEGYPPTEICDVIERLQSKELNQHFDVKIHNSRGVTIRGAFDGGTLEQQEADFYAQIAQKHRNTHPTVCRIFEGLAKGLLQEGARHDHRAKVDSLEC